MQTNRRRDAQTFLNTPIGALVADVANSERPFNPPRLRGLQMHYLGRLASNSAIF